MRRKDGFSPGDVACNLSVSLSGSKYSGDVQQYLDAWQFLFELAPKGLKQSAQLNKQAAVSYGHTRVTLKEFLAELHKETIGLMKFAIEQRDGSFFRELADLIEEPQELGHPHELWLLAMCCDWQTRKQVHYFTARELVKLARERIKWIVGQRRMLTVCNRLGLRLRASKEGRPKGSTKTRNSLEVI